MASGRALALNRSEGFTKMLFDEKGTVIGGAIVGVSAGDLIAEIALAVEMGCDAEDVALTIHPHPTLSESVMMATEVYEGTVTDLYIPSKEKESVAMDRHMVLVCLPSFLRPIGFPQILWINCVKRIRNIIKYLFYYSWPLLL